MILCLILELDLLVSVAGTGFPAPALRPGRMNVLNAAYEKSRPALEFFWSEGHRTAAAQPYSDEC